jgi:DnaJ-class molecular chaperone
LRREKKPKPLGACAVCHALTNERANLNHRCAAIVGNRRCYGIYKSAIAYLWDPCEGCEATGMVGSQVCAECKGFGWTMYG